eukprot:TRINITY_DN10349_c0_g1_i2.p1 TRINITY_DN10349_c0_g1~~TRINITY_DN10349_c0_g1_i2.p1  ORF type:complete len:227 (+),score=23.04 TRINITY_DN10349_c0_g1_i2:52-732(+)
MVNTYVLIISVFISLLHVASAEYTVSSEVTFYGARDNCPPGASIAYPVIHTEAGGIGTHADPITFAGAPKCFRPGTRIYNPRLKKYFIMEDECEECEQDWENRKYHVDCWIGPPTLTAGTELIACENALTVDSETIIVDPNSTLPVDTTPLFNGATEKCIVYAPPCHDQGNECGNECQIPQTASCADLAKQYYLTLQRFEQLNPQLNCNRNVPSGTTVCQGGTCGD